MGGAQSSSAVTSPSSFLEGVSETEIDLHKVVGSPIGEHIASFAEEPNVGRKAIFESDADVAEYAIRSEALAQPAYSAARDTYHSGLPRRIIGHRKALADRAPFILPAQKNTTETSEHVWRQVNARPEFIQRQPQHAVCHNDARRHAASANCMTHR